MDSRLERIGAIQRSVGFLHNIRFADKIRVHFLTDKGLPLDGGDHFWQEMEKLESLVEEFQQLLLSTVNNP
jgi:hypothetical protein